MKKLFFIVILFQSLLAFSQKNCEKWKVYEITLKGPSSGNPFQEVSLSATFSNGSTQTEVSGFYDGDGIYRIRFMPAGEGKWNYLTKSNQKVLNNRKGEFICTPPLVKNHGPVMVKDTFYFAYADGTRHNSFGTTSYAWIHQGDSLAQLTLQTLSNGVFNKMRMCIFPKDHYWNKNEPLLYPFEGKPLKDWDYSRFYPAYFRNIEKRIAQLDSLGIEADLIVFHPYDRWGFQEMGKEANDRYIKYIIARFAAYKNVWWSIANEYDLMKAMNMDDWDHFIELFATLDPYRRLISIHSMPDEKLWYDHTNPLISHASIQNEDTYKARESRIKYRKPVVFDECRYEGNIPFGWGNITAVEMVNKFWTGFTNGGHVGHSETILVENPLNPPLTSSEVMWWSKGGVLRGESPARIKFLREIIESAPGNLGLSPRFRSSKRFTVVSYKEEYYLAYCSLDQSRAIIISLPEGKTYKVEIIDAWNMTIKPLPGTYTGRCMVELPGKPFTALRVMRTP